jgi:hypothetical protein
MALTKYYVALLAMLVLGGLTPEKVREYGKSGDAKIDTFVVKRPYATVTQDLKRKSEECLNKTFRITVATRSGFIGTSEHDYGTTKYIPVAHITPTHAEFYTKHWDSESRAVNTPAGDKFVFYVADVTPKGSNATGITLYYFDYDRYRWGHDVIKAWALGEDPGCPILSGMY